MEGGLPRLLFDLRYGMLEDQARAARGRRALTVRRVNEGVAVRTGPSAALRHAGSAQAHVDQIWAPMGLGLVELTGLIWAHLGSCGAWPERARALRLRSWHWQRAA
jgi:hypothetical protein